MLGEISRLSAKLPAQRIKDIKEANACLRRHLRVAVPWKISSIPLEQLKFVVFADASLAMRKAPGAKTQEAYLI